MDAHRGLAGGVGAGDRGAARPARLGGRYLFVDLRVGPLHGCVAEWDEKFSFDDAIHWPSITEMLSDIADALTHGTPAMTFHAAGRLRHFAANPDALVDTYRATVSSSGRLAWVGESF